MRLKYAGKLVHDDMRTLFFHAPKENVTVCVCVTDGKSYVQAFATRSITVTKKPDVAKLVTLCVAHPLSLEFTFSDPTREEVDRALSADQGALRWLEYSLNKVERQLSREKDEYRRWRGVRDLDEAEDHLSNRREEIFDLNQKLLHNAREPQLVYSSRFVPSAWQVTDRIRFHELKDQAKERASAVRQRIDFERRTRIKDLEDKRKDLRSEIKEEQKSRKSRETRITEILESDLSAGIQLAVRTRPLRVKGRRGPAVRNAAEAVAKETESLASKLASAGFALSKKTPAILPILHGRRPEFLASRAGLEQDLQTALSGLLSQPGPAALPDLSGFPSPAEGRRLAYLGLALTADLRRTETPLWFDLDEQGPRHVAVSGGSGSGKSTAASLLVEGALLYDVPVVVFDPTRSWTGFALPCSSSRLLNLYEAFFLRPEWARAFETRIVEPEPALHAKDDVIGHEGLTVVTPRDLTEDQERAYATRLLRRLLTEIKGWPESQTLRLLVVLEEAHRYLKGKDKALQSTVELLARTARVRGLGLVFSSQVATDLPPGIRSNCATLIQLNTRYAQDLTRAAQSFGSEYRDLVPRLARGQGAYHFPEYGTTLATFRPPLHSATALPEPVAALHKANRDLQRTLATLMPDRDIHATTLESPDNDGSTGETTIPATSDVTDWRDVAAAYVAACNKKPPASEVLDHVKQTGQKVPSLRTIQRFLAAHDSRRGRSGVE